MLVPIYLSPNPAAQGLRTALHVASSSGQSEAVASLLAHGADVALKDKVFVRCFMQHITSLLLDMSFLPFARSTSMLTFSFSAFSGYSFIYWVLIRSIMFRRFFGWGRVTVKKALKVFLLSARSF
jgi:hypothetical protein